MKKITTASGCIVSIFAALSIQAQFLEIDISSHVNKDLETYSTTVWPFGGTQLNVAGVPFGLAELENGTNTLGVVQSLTNAFGFGPFSYSFSVPTGIQASSLYCLMNSTCGSAGTLEGSITVTGTQGETAVLNCVEGINIRDYNDSIYVNTLSDPTVASTNFDGGRRLDRQQLVLPGTFSGDTVASIVFQGNANGCPDGQAFLVGLTLGTTNSIVPQIPVLSVGSTHWSVNGINLTLLGPIGANYEAYSSADLVSWQPCGNFTSTSYPYYFSLPVTNFMQGFYRVVIP